MKIINKEISIKTKGDTDVIDITSDVEAILNQTRLSNGSILLFVPGSTASLSTIEYEPNLLKDLKAALERVIPSKIHYAHTQTWQDDNGHAHIRATVMGPSMQIPFVKGKLQLGTWQQIVLLDFDTSPRDRRIIAQFMGE